MTYENCSVPGFGAWNVIDTVLPSAVHVPFEIVVSDTLVVMSNVITVRDAVPSALNCQIVCWLVGSPATVSTIVCDHDPTRLLSSCPPPPPPPAPLLNPPLLKYCGVVVSMHATAATARATTAARANAALIELRPEAAPPPLPLDTPADSPRRCPTMECLRSVA